MIEKKKEKLQGENKTNKKKAQIKTKKKKREKEYVNAELQHINNKELGK